MLDRIAGSGARLAAYAHPLYTRRVEIATSVLSYLAVSVLMYLALDVSYLLTLALALPADRLPGTDVRRLSRLRARLSATLQARQ